MESVGNTNNIISKKDVLAWAKKQGVFTPVKNALANEDTFTEDEVKRAFSKAGAGSKLKGFKET